MITQIVNSLKLNQSDYPDCLSQISGPPKELFFIGKEPSAWLNRSRVAVVGSRKMTPYGKSVTEKITIELARAGVVIMSGLALGVDATAHRAAIDTGGTTVAVLPTSLDNIYPTSHRNLAQKIIDTGGALISEYRSSDDIFTTNFVARNRIVSGLSDVVLITEAALKSGSLHTARFGLEQGKTVMAVPGNINNPGSEGCNNLIKSGAVPVTKAEDVLFALGIKRSKLSGAKGYRGSPLEENLLKLISDGISSQEELALASEQDGARVISALTTLEISGQIRPEGGGNWTLA